ncbi:MAG: pilus assembly protein TadG-related protein [Acidimicrobiales bacterium]
MYRYPSVQAVQRGHRSGGQVLPLILVGLLLATVLALGAVRLGVATAQRASAQASADAAALAGAADGRTAAEAAAEANGARLVSYQEERLDVEVEVIRRGVRSRARARWSGT